MSTTRNKVHRTRKRHILAGMNIKLNREQKVRVKNAKDIAFIMRQILLRDNKNGREREHFWVVGLDAASYIQYVELIALGTKTNVPVEPVEVFKWAIQKGVHTIILCHSHPSYSTKPSVSDKVVTDRLIQVGFFVGVPVADHIIINAKNNRYLSFETAGIMRQLKRDSLWMLPDNRIEIERLTGKTEAINEMISELLKKKVSADVIKLATGASRKMIQDVEKRFNKLSKGLE
jgi:DNA repair protein RadC